MQADKRNDPSVDILDKQEKSVAFGTVALRSIMCNNVVLRRLFI